MKAIEFEVELTGDNTLKIPPEIASVSPSRGKATVLLHLDIDAEDAEWRKAACEYFLRDDSKEDAVYEKCI